MTDSKVRRGAAAIVGVLLLSGAAACETPHHSSPSRSATPTTADIGQKPAAEILAAAQDALTHARSVRITGKVTDKDGPMSLNLRIGSGQGVGTISAPVRGKKAVVDLRVTDGRVYLHGSQFPKALGGEAVARVLRGRWISMPQDRTGDLNDILDPGKVAKSLTAEGEVTKGETRMYRGVPVIVLRDEGSVMYVAAKGKPYPLHIGPDGAGKGTDRMDFLDYDIPFTVPVPKHVLKADGMPGTAPA
jgi:hypothetical protein